ncbi:MAG: WecB/TagA/CpsF family glycosyltransferase [Oscillospiraceae bacterium]|jgi:N-acetylglucosaminyldiphosphoundecaprenol N-acetyl-beta-D-mannosaminyltransferase|nr:WecB/TagA/CpsF family glycosyltransferase [Oscillospiraceae bacterium]
MTEQAYQCPRDFTVLGAVGVNAFGLEALVDTLYALPRTPVAATLTLVGLPCAIWVREHPAEAHIYNESTIAQIDGMPAAKMARRRGLNCGHFSGMDIMDATIRRGVAAGSRHFFYGGRDTAQLRQLKAQFLSRYPAAQIVGMHSPPFRPLTDAEEAALRQDVLACQPDFIWVGIGAPKQDYWLHDHRAALPGCVMLGVGAAFNFLTGDEPKAPAWMADHYLEWLFRLLRSPRRLWRRYVLGGFKVLYYSAKDRLGR